MDREGYEQKKQEFLSMINENRDEVETFLREHYWEYMTNKELFRTIMSLTDGADILTEMQEKWG
jgi:hypothetical protein